MLKKLYKHIFEPSILQNKVTMSPIGLGLPSKEEVAPASSFEAATSMVEVTSPPKKLSTKRLTNPSYLTRAATKGEQLPEEDLRTANSDLSQLRFKPTTKETLNALAKTDPDMSSSVSMAGKLVVTGGENLIVRDMDGRLNPEATKIGQQLLRSFTYLSDYSIGYAPSMDIRGVSEALVRESQIYGGMAVELVLNKARLPYMLRPVSVSQLKWATRADGSVYPVQKIGQNEIHLDIPTFFYTSIDQDLLTPYSSSPLEPGLQPMIANIDFLNDLRRVFRSAINPRVMTTIDTEKWLSTVPPEVQHDPALLQSHMNNTITGIADHINGLEPQEGLVLFDMLKTEHLTRGNVSLSNEWSEFSTILNAKLSAGLKAPGIVLGRMASASSNVASTESLLYSKQLSGIQAKLNVLYSKIFTLALRLYGYEVYAEFSYKTFDLRPELELEAFKAMKQSRVLEQLSLGMISDEEANLKLTGTLPPEGAQVLSGTMFKSGSRISSNPYTNTGSAMDQTLDTDTPKESKTA